MLEVLDKVITKRMPLGLRVHQVEQMLAQAERAVQAALMVWLVLQAALVQMGIHPTVLLALQGVRQAQRFLERLSLHIPTTGQ